MDEYEPTYSIVAASPRITVSWTRLAYINACNRPIIYPVRLQPPEFRNRRPIDDKIILFRYRCLNV